MCAHSRACVRCINPCMPHSGQYRRLSISVFVQFLLVYRLPCLHEVHGPEEEYGLTCVHAYSNVIACTI